MLVKIHGFEWHSKAPGIDVAAFLEYLKSVSGSRTKDGKHIFAMTEKDGYYVGILLSIKDNKRYCQMKDFKVTASELEEGRSFVDLNFFLIHPTTGKGVYQSYFHSTSLNYFCVICQYFYREFKKSLGNTKRGALDYSILATKQGLIEATENLKAVKRIEIEQVTYDFKELCPNSASTKGLFGQERFLPEKS